MQNRTSRVCTHKRAGNVGFRGNSGRGLGIAECPLMTHMRHWPYRNRGTKRTSTRAKFVQLYGVRDMGNETSLCDIRFAEPD